MLDLLAAELAAAAWEWGDGLRTGTLGGARDFITGYRQAGGTAQPLTKTALRQLIRARLRWEIQFKRGKAARTQSATGDDPYTAAQAAAYHELRPART
jgi:hypothetical protein